MTPQMKQILEQFDKLPLCHPDIESDDTEQYYAGQAHMKQHMREFVMKACVEYALSIVPSREPSNIYNTGSSADMSRLGFNACVAECFLAIQQDSLDLPTN